MLANSGRSSFSFNNEGDYNEGDCRGFAIAILPRTLLPLLSRPAIPLTIQIVV